MLATENAEYKLGDVDRGFGRIKARGNAAEQGAEIRERDPHKVFDPSDKSRPDTFYPYNLQDTAGLEKRLEADAGPRGFGGFRAAR